MIINLFAKKGRKTWIGKIVDQELNLEFITGSWGKKKGLLEFHIKEEGYYITQDSLREYWRVFKNKDGNLEKKKSKKDEIIKSFVFEQLEKNKQKRKFSFEVIKYSVKNTAWDLEYTQIDDNCYFSEHENYYMITGNFLKKFIKYERNFSRISQKGEKKEELENILFHKEKDNIKIEFLDEDRTIITKPVIVDKNSIIINGPTNLVGIINPT